MPYGDPPGWQNILHPQLAAATTIGETRMDPVDPRQAARIALLEARRDWWLPADQRLKHGFRGPMNASERQARRLLFAAWCALTRHDPGSLLASEIHDHLWAVGGVPDEVFSGLPRGHRTSEPEGRRDSFRDEVR